MRAAVVVFALASASVAAAASDPPPRDAKSWGLLIEAAKKRGATETRLDKSSSYVFQQENGDFLTLTEWRTPPKHFVCTIAKDQKSTVCVRWETGQTTYGERADVASPWKTRIATALEDTEPTTPEGQFIGSIAGFIGGALGMKSTEVTKIYYNYYFRAK